MELGTVDLQSLEPVDKRYRPIRLKDSFCKVGDIFSNEYYCQKIDNIINSDEYHKLKDVNYILSLEY